MVKFLHCAKLGVVVGKGIDGMKSHLPLCLRSGLAVALFVGVLSPNAELAKALAALCKPGLIPWTPRSCLQELVIRILCALQLWHVTVWPPASPCLGQAGHV